MFKWSFYIKNDELTYDFPMELIKSASLINRITESINRMAASIHCGLRGYLPTMAEMAEVLRLSLNLRCCLPFHKRPLFVY